MKHSTHGRDLRDIPAVQVKLGVPRGQFIFVTVFKELIQYLDACDVPGIDRTKSLIVSGVTSDSIIDV